MTTKKKKPGASVARQSAPVAQDLTQAPPEAIHSGTSGAGSENTPGPDGVDAVPPTDTTPAAEQSDAPSRNTILDAPSPMPIEPAGEGDGDSGPDEPDGSVDPQPHEDLPTEPIAEPEPVAHQAQPTYVNSPMAGEGVAPDDVSGDEHDGLLPQMPHYESILILESQIDFSPRNHREQVDEEKVYLMAANMREMKYVIGPVTVRVVTEGRYELVVGELRLRAARLAGIVYIPAVIRQVSDEVVDVMQLAENIHRDDPHIMAQARKVASMVSEKKSIADIALGLGLSVSAVYVRYQLANLVPDFERLYRAEIIKTKAALALATLSPESQNALFEEVGKGWEQRKSTGASDIPYIVSRYRCDLKTARFDLSENELVPGVGSCYGCRFNLSGEPARSLFDDDRLLGRCGNATCFDNKTWAAFLRDLTVAIREQSVAALVFDGGPSKVMDEELPKIPGASELPRYDRDDIDIVTPPVEPAKEHYIAEYGADPDQWSESYELDLGEYNQRMGNLTTAIAEGKIISGLSMEGFEIKPILFTVRQAADAIPSPEPEDSDERPEEPKVAKMTTPQIQEAVVKKTVDAQLLRNEINGIRVSQSQAERDDSIATARSIAGELREKTEAACKGGKFTPTAADRWGIFMVLHDSLSYKNRAKANLYLFGKEVDQIDREILVKRARKHSVEDLSCLIRLIYAYDDSAKQPSQASHSIMREIAQGAGVRVKKIDSDAAAKVENRRKRNAVRIRELNAMIEKAEAPAKQAKGADRKVKAQPSPKGVAKTTPKPVNGKPVGRVGGRPAAKKVAANARAKRA